MIRLSRPILGAALLLGLSLGSSASEGAGPYTLPAVSYITATEPATFFSPETHLACLARSEQPGFTVTTSLVCYGAEKPSPPPPPPPPPYGPARNLLLTGAFIQSTGVLLLPVLNCTVIYPGVAFSAGIGIQLAKGGAAGSGSVVFTTDTNGPNYTCDDGTVTQDDLTLTPLAQDHDQDGDGCTDWEELDPASPDRDPFNPNDCGAGGNPVGGIAELPEVPGTLAGRRESTGGSTGVFAATVVSVATAGILALGGAAWYARQRRLR